MVVEIGDVRVDGHAIARFQKFLSKDLLFIEKEYAIVQSAERAVDVGIDSEEGSGKPLDVLDACPFEDELTAEGEELFQKECTFERLAGAGIDFLIHDGVDCMRRHLHITRCRLDLVFVHISHHLDQKGFSKLHIWIRDEKNVHMIVIHQIKSTKVVSI